MLTNKIPRWALLILLLLFVSILASQSSPA